MKKAFTLIEVLIAIMIFSLLFLAESNFISNIKNFKNSISIKEKKDFLEKVLYYDILLSQNIKIERKKDYDKITLITTNSLYEIPLCKVIWYVKKNALIRVEDIKTKDFYDKIDVFAKNVKKFRVFRKGNKYLIYIKINNKDLAFMINS